MVLSVFAWWSVGVPGWFRFEDNGRAQLGKRREDDFAARFVALAKHRIHAFHHRCHRLNIPVGDLEFAVNGGRLPIDADDDCNRMALGLPPLHPCERFHVDKSPGQVGELHRCPIDVRIAPGVNRLVDGHSRQTLDRVIAPVKPHEAHDEGLETVVAAELANVLRARAEFVEHRRRGVRHLQLAQQYLP